MDTFISRSYTYVLIGASSNEEKYGYKILENLLDAGFHVLPINPKGGQILGQKVYKNINEIAEGIDVVIFVVPPQVTKNIIEDVVSLGITKVWLQPGSESDEVIEFCDKHNIDCYHHACIMLEQLRYLAE
jgi:predicted CoA-binding protein